MLSKYIYVKSMKKNRNGKLIEVHSMARSIAGTKDSFVVVSEWTNEDGAKTAARCLNAQLQFEFVTGQEATGEVK